MKNAQIRKRRLRVSVAVGQDDGSVVLGIKPRRVGKRGDAEQVGRNARFLQIGGDGFGRNERGDVVGGKARLGEHGHAGRGGVGGAGKERKKQAGKRSGAAQGRKIAHN